MRWPKNPFEQPPRAGKGTRCQKGMAFYGQKYWRQTRKVWIHMPERFLGQARKCQPALDIKQRGVKLCPPITRLLFELL